MSRTLFVLLFVPLTVRADEAKKPAQEAKQSEKAGLSYLLYLPPGYEKSETKFPTIVFLHGSGETGSDLEKVKKHGPPKNVETKRDFEFIVVSPQAPVRGWKPEQVLALLDEV